MSVCRLLVVLALITCCAATARARSEALPSLRAEATGDDAASGASARGDGARLVTPLRARQVLEALTALGFLLYLRRRRSRRPWRARRRVRPRGEAATLSSLGW